MAILPNIKNKKYFIYGFVLLVVTLVPLLTKSVIFDFRLFVHDFSQERIFSRFSYHLALMLQPTILAWIIFINAKGFWKTVSLITFLYFLKDSLDVIMHNNVAPNFEFDLISYSLIVVSTILWHRLIRN